MKKEEREYARLFIDPVPLFFDEFMKFISENFYTMDLHAYQSFADALYEKHATGKRIDFVLHDIIESCCHVSQIHPDHRNKRFIHQENDAYLSIGQKVWLNEILKEIGVI